MEESAHDFQSSDNRAKQSRILYNFENFARIIPTLYNVLYIYIYVRRVKFPRSKCQNIFKVSSFERKRKKRLGLAGNCVNIWLILRWTRAYRIFARKREREREEGEGKNGGRLASRATSDSSLLPAIFHQRSARFSIRCRDNEVLIATGDRFESQCATRVYSSPAFPPFFNTSFLFRFNRCTSKVVSTIFPTPSVQTLFRASLSLSLSLSRVIPSLFISFPPIRVFFFETILRSSST